MKCALVFTGSGPIVVTTSYDSLENANFLERLTQKGIEKFIAFEVPEASVRRHYGYHFNVVCENLTETDELRVLDYDGVRVLSIFDFSELGPPIYHEAHEKQAAG